MSAFRIILNIISKQNFLTTNNQNQIFSLDQFLTVLLCSLAKFFRKKSHKNSCKIVSWREFVLVLKKVESDTKKGFEAILPLVGLDNYPFTHSTVFWRESAPETPRLPIWNLNSKPMCFRAINAKKKFCFIFSNLKIFFLTFLKITKIISKYKIYISYTYTVKWFFDPVAGRGSTV